MASKTGDAMSPYLNLPIRSEAEAAREIEQARLAEAARKERARGIEHGTAFCRLVLDGAKVTSHSDPTRATTHPDYLLALHHVAQWAGLAVQGSADPATICMLLDELAQLRDSRGGN